VTPLAVPGRWRLRTRPAARARRRAGAAQFFGGDNPFALQAAAQQRERMPAQAEPEAGIVGDQVLAFGEGKQVGLRLRHVPHGKRRGALDAGDVPVGLPAVAGEAGERAGGGEALEVARVDAASCGEVIDAVEGLLRARRGEAGHAFQREPLHLPQPQAQRGFAALPLFQRAVPLACQHVDRPHLDAVAARVLHDLGGA